MDENYLDQLLKKVEQNDAVTGTGSIPDEEPEPISSNLDMEENLDTDSANIQDVAWSDAEISTEEISELDELDKLADVDMNDMDFADIDFDDVDVTKMDFDELRSPLSEEDIRDLQIDENYLDESADDDFEREFRKLKQGEMPEEINTLPKETEEMLTGASTEKMTEESGEDSATASDSEEMEMSDTDIDAMFKEVFGDEGPDLKSQEAVSHSPLVFFTEIGA